MSDRGDHLMVCRPRRAFRSTDWAASTAPWYPRSMSSSSRRWRRPSPRWWCRSISTAATAAARPSSKIPTGIVTPTLYTRNAPPLRGVSENAPCVDHHLRRERETSPRSISTCSRCHQRPRSKPGYLTAGMTPRACAARHATAPSPTKRSCRRTRSRRRTPECLPSRPRPMWAGRWRDPAHRQRCVRSPGERGVPVEHHRHRGNGLTLHR